MVEYAGSHLSVSNPLTAKSLARIEQDVFSYLDLENMGMDCLAIFFRLLQVISPNADFENALKFVRDPWRYKPPQRASGKKQRRK